VWEIDPPEGQERLDWILLTNQPVNTFEDAYRVVGWYESRWIIEAKAQFHFRSGRYVRRMDTDDR
jgi:hypothetical protein